MATRVRMALTDCNLLGHDKTLDCLTTVVEGLRFPRSAVDPQPCFLLVRVPMEPHCRSAVVTAFSRHGFSARIGGSRGGTKKPRLLWHTSRRK